MTIFTSIGERIKYKQPNEYALLMSWCYVKTSPDEGKAYREIERLMRHSSFKREHGVIKQRGWA